MRKGMFWEPLPDKKVVCNLCAHRCVIRDGKPGVCFVRFNEGGVLYTVVDDRIVSANVDPIEKKPLFHFLPGSRSYSIATVGCNFRCLHCQNYEISQASKRRERGGKPPASFREEMESRAVGEFVTPDEIVEAAVRTGCRSISYTYTEPTIFYELAFETAKRAAEKGIANVFVTNGFITPEALREIRSFLHAANIDLKAFTEEFYKKVCGAALQPVLDSIRLHRELGIWIEVTTLIIPHHNDSEEELRKIAEFIVGVDPEIPWHVTQFYPTYKLTDEPRTPVSTLRRAREIGFEAGLKYVYEGNVPGEGGENTYCPSCKSILIERFGFSILKNRLDGGRCPDCGAAQAGVWLGLPGGRPTAHPVQTVRA
ncbi:MAG: AmmeMemoRadiSam system radical SAM enzyme [Nitrospirae bacterium]|nr:AmmeMemoRadiSam system radical SAM enzyme [Nitrospirota bacterium]